MPHRWTEPNRRDPNSTERNCIKCGMLKVSRHEPDNDPPHWFEYELVAGDRYASVKVPTCVPA